MTTEHVLIIGGSSGMGLALAERLVADGVRVTIAGRSTDRLTAATDNLQRPDLVQAVPVDIGREDQMRALLSGTAPLNHIAVTAADATGATGPLVDFDLDRARAVVDTKLFGPWLVAKHAGPRLLPGASLTFTAGVAAHRPGPGASITAAVNGALEGLTRALALELAPVRVNAVSPGWTDTPLWTTIAGEGRDERLAAMAGRLPAGRVGRPSDIAAAFIALMRNEFITGTILSVDGGQRLV
jgi:NAD(P)-dependent dehydrogenase (short-subunit alcohol dehydrogenase family)